MRLLLALLAILVAIAKPADAHDPSDDLVVVIANKTYKHAAEVKFAHRDGEAFAKAAVEALGIPASRVRPILRDLTSFELKRLFAKDGEIAGLMRGRRRTARLIVYYSGHGVPVEGQGHLLPVDAPPGAAGAAAYDIEQLRGDLVAIKPADGQVLVFLDACFSGQTGTGAPLVPGSSANSVVVFNLPTARQRDVVVFAASRRAEVAWWDEAADRQHGLFTDTLIDGLYGLASEDGKQLTVAALERFLHQRMSERLAVIRPGHTQTADVAALDKGMVISTYPAGPRVRDAEVAAFEKRQCQLLQGETDPARIEAFTERECRICACRPALRDLARELRRKQAETAAACAAEQRLWPAYKGGDAARIELFLQAATCPAVIAEAKAALAAKQPFVDDPSGADGPGGKKGSSDAPWYAPPSTHWYEPAPAPGAAPPPPAKVRIGTGGTASTTFPIGNMIASLISGTELDARAVVTKGTSGNIEGVVRGDLVVAMGGAGEVSKAYLKDIAKFTGASASDLRAIAHLYETTQLFTSARQPDSLIYAITKALWSDKARTAFATGYDKARAIRRETALAGLTLPLHPGAEKFYREAGMLGAAPKGSGPAPAPPKGSDPAPKVAAIEPPRPAAGSDPALAVVPGSGKSFRDKLADGQDCPFCPSMVVVPAGDFVMGSSHETIADLTKRFPAIKQLWEAEGPQRQIIVTKPYAIGQFEVTQNLWNACVRAGGCPKRASSATGQQPVSEVSWDDAVAYLEWISAQTGRRYRLPSEVEWEYAARAGTRTHYHFGDGFDAGKAHISSGTFGSTTVVDPVGSYPPNRWGLFDVHGNAQEWVADCWLIDAVETHRKGIPVGAAFCPLRVTRGGSIADEAPFLRSAARFKMPPGTRHFALGFRVARTIAP